MSISPNTTAGGTGTMESYTPPTPPPDRKNTIVLAVLAVVLAAGMYAQYSYTKSVKDELASLLARIEQANELQDKGLEQLHTRLKDADTRQSDLQGALAEARNKLGATASDLAKTRQTAAELARQQQEAQENAVQLSNQLGQLAQDQQVTKGSLANVATDVTGVKTEVKSTQAELTATKAELKRVVGDLGVQSDLIARTGTDLADLRARGEREYIEFDLDKKAKRKKVGMVSIELKKTDDKRQKFTIALTADDKTVEKKDRNPFEPVQFYLQGQRAATEIVVQKVMKDRITGYISTPKVKDSRASM
jgi:chromosome segregation ATPase